MGQGATPLFISKNRVKAVFECGAKARGIWWGPYFCPMIGGQLGPLFVGPNLCPTALPHKRPRLLYTTFINETGIGPLVPLLFKNKDTMVYSTHSLRMFAEQNNGGCFDVFAGVDNTVRSRVQILDIF